MNRLFRLHPIGVIAFCSLILALSLPWFDRQIAQPRFDAAQFSHYQPGDTIPFIVCWAESSRGEEGARVRDFKGAVVPVFSLKETLPPGSVLVLKGTMIEGRQVRVEDVDFDPLFPFKAWGSFVAFLFILWKLARFIRWTPQGLQLKVPDPPMRETPCQT